MWRPTEISTPVVSEPVSLDEVKARGRIDHDDDDGTLKDAITQARSYAEHYSSSRIATVGLTLRCSSFDDFACLPEAPLQSIAAIQYVDADGDEQTLPEAVCESWGDGLDARIVLQAGQSWPAIASGSWITLTGLFGYAAVPPAVQQAIIRHALDADASRENPSAHGHTVFDFLMSNHRR